MNKQQLLADISKVAARHGVTEFILVFAHLDKPGQVLDQVEISSISSEPENGHCRAFFQWLKRQIILKLQ